MCTGNILETLQSDGRFGRFLPVLGMVGLEDRLKQEGPFTVFAPTDDAFAKIPEPNLKMILDVEQMLSHIADAHYVHGRHSLSELERMNLFRTAEGTGLEAKRSDEGTMLDSAKVVQADMEANNGVIHAIDRVIEPARREAAVSPY